jgi:TRAP transporter TAXI family solute receptor
MRGSRADRIEIDDDRFLIEDRKGRTEMKRYAIAMLGLIAFALAGTANAQVISIVTTPTGSYTNSAGAAMAKVISDKTKIHAVLQAQAQSGFYAVQAGTAEFGMSNSFDVGFFVTGTAEYEGKGPQKNVRQVAAMLPYRVAMFVRKDSPIKSLAELKGKRLSAGFSSQKTIGRIIAAHLANAGLSYDDVQKVLTPNVKRGADDFIAGKTDALFFAVGSAAVKRAAATVGGLRVLPIDDSPKAVERMEQVLPGSYVLNVKPRPGLEGIEKPTNVVAFDMALFTNKNVSDDVVYTVAKTLHDNKKALIDIFKPFVLFRPNHMSVVVKHVPFHPGALKYYKEIGIAPK